MQHERGTNYGSVKFQVLGRARFSVSDEFFLALKAHAHQWLATHDNRRSTNAARTTAP